MQRIFLLANPVKHYPWGSKHTLPKMLGLATPSESPYAEIWMGAHPSAPSTTMVNGTDCSLANLIARNRGLMFGDDFGNRFDGKLPFLLKILAAEQPLSIQVHPSKEQARAGFQRENAKDIALNAANRSYKDDNHKPEMLYAVTPFRMMVGFRESGQIAANLSGLSCQPADQLKKALAAAAPLQEFAQTLLSLSDQAIKTLISEVVGSVSRFEPLLSELIKQFAALYDGDLGILAPLFLNVIELQPGQAVFLGSGIMHAYIRGVGIELMANSDNVLRCGLTEKYIDKAELSKSLLCQPYNPTLLKTEINNEGLNCFENVSDEFSLATLELDKLSKKITINSFSIISPIDGEVTIVESQSRQQVDFSLSEAAVVVAGSVVYLSGRGSCAIASIP